MRNQLQLAWIGVVIFVGGCHGFFSAPRSASEFGSKRLLNSYSRLDIHLKIIEYNEDLSINTTHEIQRSDNFGWSSVKSCDQYYLALSTSLNWDGLANLFIFYLPNNSASDLNQITIPINVTQETPLAIAVAPSGRNFVFLNGSHLLVFEVEPQLFNWTIIAAEPISAYFTKFRGYLAMSDSKIRFIYNYTSQYTYNYKTKTISVRDLPTGAQFVGQIDTYNDYWLYTSQKDAILEDPNGDMQVFNYSVMERLFDVGQAFILPPQLSATKEFIDIAVYQLSNSIFFGTLNSKTHLFEQYNTLPSKSLGLLATESADPRKINVLYFAVGHSVVMYQVPDQYESVALAVPSLPGNHSCSMNGQTRLPTYWCGGFGRFGPTNPCPSGTYQPSSGYTTCSLCPEGTYQPQEGSINCLPCKEDEYCPLGSSQPEIISKNSSSHVTWDFPISETTTSFEEILLMLLFASSITNTSISVVLLGCIIITAAMLISLLVKHCCGVNLHQWLAKIDIHKKTKYKTIVKPSGTFKTDAIKVESVFGGYLTLLAAYILLTGLITTIIYVNDYHPLLVGQYNSTQKSPSQNSVRMASLQDYNTQSKASELANIIKDNLSLNISIIAYNFQTTDGDLVDQVIITDCDDQYGDACEFSFGTAQFLDQKTAIFELQTKGSIRFTEAAATITLGQQAFFTFATVEISTSSGDKDNFQTSTAKYLVLPGDNKILTGLLLIPVTMTVVVRETELDTEEFNRDAYMSFVSDESKLQNMGHSNETFALTNDGITLQFLLQLDNNWRLESEQRRFSGIGAFFAALLAILGLYEVTLLASELAHRVFHSIEKRRKKRSKYQALEDPPLIVNEKFE